MSWLLFDLHFLLRTLVDRLCVYVTNSEVILLGFKKKGKQSKAFLSFVSVLDHLKDHTLSNFFPLFFFAKATVLLLLVIHERTG